MNVIEQTVKVQNGAIDLHITVPESLDGYLVKAVIVYEKVDITTEEPKRTGLSKHRGAFAHLPLEQRLEMQKQLDDMRNEWERPI
ncbi:hypothetical protein [uncultured Fibrella sp.]|uniref:hypothetical protein n=1 Tax=uncultured Fibrella sp. TaxID=1284596 RepID=UPI0035C9CE63